MIWYLLFLAAVFLLWLGATDADRSALRIVLLASLASLLLVTFVTRHITGSWKLVVPATVETVTILALLRWASNRTGWKQAACVLTAWFVHVLCFADIQLGTNMVYDRYEDVLGAVALAQLVFFHDTYIHHIRQLGRWWISDDHPGAVRASGVSAVVSHHPRSPSVQPLPQCKTIYTKT